MNELINKYQQQITEIAMFAKRINFDIEDGDVMELTKMWLQDSKEVYSEDRKEEIKRIIKFSI